MGRCGSFGLPGCQCWLRSRPSQRPRRKMPRSAPCAGEGRGAALADLPNNHDRAQSPSRFDGCGAAPPIAIASARYRLAFSAPVLRAAVCRRLRLSSVADRHRSRRRTTGGSQRARMAGRVFARNGWLVSRFWNNGASGTTRPSAIPTELLLRFAMSVGHVPGAAPAPTLTRVSAGEGMYPAPCPRQSAAPPPSDRRPA